MSKGYVYILTNPCIQYTYQENGVKKTVSPVKIGMAKDVEKRLGTLNTSLPENFIHLLSIGSDDAKALENVLHRILHEYRIYTKDGESTEFFKCPQEVAVNALKQTAKDMHLKEYKINKAKLVGRSSSRIKTNAKIAALKKDQPKNATRAAVFDFSMVGVKEGEALVFVPTGLKVTAQGKNRVVYRGAEYSLSAFVRKFIPHPNKSGAYQGPKYFTYQGKLLTDLRASLKFSAN